MRKIYFLFYATIVSFILFSYLFIDANLVYLNFLYTDFAFRERLITPAIYVAFVLFLSLFYIYFLSRSQKNNEKISLKLLFAPILLVFSYPAMLSYDIFNYIFTAKVLFFYHENPFLTMPIEFIGDPLLLFTRAANKTALYGPVWILFTSLPYLFGMGNFILTMLSFKLFVLIFYLGTSWLIWNITKNKTSVYFFALNPLVVIETLVSGHNDVVMIFFALLAFYLLEKKNLGLSLGSLLISIGIKYATIFLIPVYLFSLINIHRGKSNKETNVYVYSFITMIIVIFFLAPIREEIYPWYAVWFLAFASLCIKNSFIKYFSIVLSISLMFRYVPYIALGTYAGITPFIRSVVTFVPIAIFVIFFAFNKYVWRKKLFRLL